MMNKENMLKFMTELKTFCREQKECEKCELDAYCRAFGDATLPFEWKIPSEKRWRADMGGFYWCVTGCYMVSQSIEGAIDCDDYRYDVHNYFRTQEEAEKYARVLETEMLLRQFADEHNFKVVDWKNTDEQKYFLLVSCDTSEMEIYSTFDNCGFRIVYFNSKEIAQDAINEIGKDRIIDYLTYEW